MPLVHVEIVVRAPESLRATLAQELADRIGEASEASPGSTWVTVRPIPANQYAENCSETAEVGPVFVSILKSKRPTADKLRHEVMTLTEAIAQVVGRPRDSVHIVYQPDGTGRAAFGGALVTD